MLALDRIDNTLRNISRSAASQFALNVQKEFAQSVCDFLNERLMAYSDTKNAEHAFFIYHPDTDWTPRFSAIVYESGLNDPKGRYRGRTSSLDLAIILMEQTRLRHVRREYKRQISELQKQKLSKNKDHRPRVQK